MTVVWIACGAALVALAWYVLWRRPIRCHLRSKRIRGVERTAHYPIDGRRRVICGRCDDNNLRLASAEPQGR